MSLQPENTDNLKVHILLIHQAFAALDEPGGTRHIEMARAFAKQGHRVTIITSPVNYLTGRSSQAKARWRTQENPEPGIEIIRAYTYSALHRSFFHRLLSFFSFMFSSFFIGLGVKNVSVVWGTSPPIFQGWTAWLLARLKRINFVFEVRDLWPAFAIAMNVIHNPLIISLSNWLERFLYRHADQLVVNSPGFIEHITSRGGKNIVLIPNGVDTQMFYPLDNGDEFRRRLGLEGKVILLYSGAHGVSNDLAVLLQAAKLTLADESIVYVLVGDGKEKPSLQRLAEEWKLKNVFFSAPVSKSEMGKVLAAADACLAILKPVELYKTTYPNKVFDYLAAGRPVICAIDGVIREVVEAAEAGVFSTPGDPGALAQAVNELARDPESARRMGMNGRVYVEQHFNRQIIAQKMEKLLVSNASAAKSQRS